MACVKPDCAYTHDATGELLPPALTPNADISGIGVLIGFVGIAYVTFALLVLQYLIGKSSETNLDGSTNPIDQGFLSFFWGTLKLMWGLPRRWAPIGKLLPPLRKPSERFGRPLKQAVLAMRDAQIVTGLAILIGAYSEVNCGLSIFHWHMVVRLAWFASVTHLTTLTFLRRYIHDNRGIRIFRLFFMLALMLMLAVALIPTGGECGLENYTPYFPSLDNYYVEQYNKLPPVYPGSPAKCCFMAMSDRAGFIGYSQNNFDVMIISEALLIGSSFTRVFKLFRSSSEFLKTWLRHKPAQMCKLIARTQEERYYGSYSQSARGMYVASHCAIMAFITFVRAIYDCADSILLEILWLLFSLIWGTIRIFGDRRMASVDFAARDDSLRDTVLQENSWGFGQLIPTLLLILPLFSLLEGVIGILKSKSTDSIEDDIPVALNEAPLSNRPSKEEPCGGLPPCTNSYIKLRRTRSDLVNMESNLGSNSENLSSTATRYEPEPPSEHPLQSETGAQLRNSIHRRSIKIFYKIVYGFGILSVAAFFFFFAVLFLATAGDEKRLIDVFFRNPGFGN